MKTEQTDLRNNKVTTSLLLLLTCLHFEAFAAGKKVYLPPHEQYSGTRAQGMAGAFVSIANDESAIFSNPAGIGQEDGKKPKGLLRGASFPNVTAGFDRKPSEIQKVLLRSDESLSRMENAIAELDKYEMSYARTTMFPYFTVGRVQLGLLLDQETQSYRSRFADSQVSEFASESEPDLAYTSKLSLLSRSQAGGVLGFSIPHSSLGLSLGASVRAVSRATVYRDFESSAQTRSKSTAQISKAVNRTTGYGVDAGVLYKISPKMFEPTIGVSVRDLGNTQYKPVSSDDDTEVEKTNLVIGMSIQPPLGKSMGSTVSFEAHRVNDARVAVKDKLRAGVEVGIGATDITAPVLLRVGHNGRSVTLGATVDLLLVKLDFARYGELVDGPQGERIDHRFLARLSIDLR